MPQPNNAAARDPAEGVVPEDESFLSDEDMFEQAFNDKYGPANGGEENPDDEDGQPEYGAPPEGGQEQPAPETPPAQAPTAAVAAEPEWVKNLPDEAKAHLNQVANELTNLRGQYTALHGRLAPVQQENARLRGRLTATAVPAQQPAQGANSGNAQVGQSPPGAFKLADVAEFKEFQDAFPDEAKALEAVFARQTQNLTYLQRQLEGVSRGLQEVQQSSFSQRRTQELARLSDAHPDWATVRPSREFADWLQAQPAEIAQFADSPRADHCIWVLDRYKADAYIAQQFSQGGDLQQPQPGIDVAQQTRVRRQQIRSAPSLDPQQAGIGAPNGDPGQFMSEEEIWNAEVERRLRLQRESNRR